MIQTNHGACHCGRVTFEARAELSYVVDCNCSICRRTGALWHPAAESDLRILTGEGDLVLYQFNTNTAKHYFCKHCGIHPLIRPRLDPSRWAFNARCIEGVDLDSIKVLPFDGQNWEATAKAYHERLKKPDISSYHLRPARASDVEGIERCVDAAYSHYIERIGRKPGPMLEDYSRVVEERQVAVAEFNGSIAGVLVLRTTPEGVLLENVAVLPAHRGIGRALLQHAESEARRQGFASLYLYTHEKMTENLRLYAKIGYIEYARRVEDGFARVYMRKNLQRQGATL